MAMLRGLRLATGAAVACGVSALALTVAKAERARPCDVMEPDPLGISWTAPCDEGRWLLDPQSGCRLWDWHPAPEDTSTWTGACPAGRKEGRGVVQWFEHGRPIDRFEGVYGRLRMLGALNSRLGRPRPLRGCGFSVWRPACGVTSRNDSPREDSHVVHCSVGPPRLRERPPYSATGGAPPPRVKMLGRWQAFELPNQTSMCAESSFCPGIGGCCGR